METTHLIRFQDCDPFGHLNNARFIDYFINAREEHLSKFYSFDPYDYSTKTGNAWLIGGHQIAYLSPAKLMEKVTIASVLMGWNANDILLEMTMWDEQKAQLKSIVWTRFVHVNLRDMKKTEHGELLTKLFKDDVDSKRSYLKFEDRIQDIKTNKNE
jgi:acyl-CoA thioester hydrolase